MDNEVHKPSRQRTEARRLRGSQEKRNDAADQTQEEGEAKKKILTVMVGVVAAVLLSSEQRNRRVHPEPRDEVVGKRSHSLSDGGGQPSSGHGPEKRRSHCPCLYLRGGKKTGGKARRSILDGQEHIISQLTLANSLPTTLRLGSFTSGGLSCGYR